MHTSLHEWITIRDMAYVGKEGGRAGARDGLFKIKCNLRVYPSMYTP